MNSKVDSKSSNRHRDRSPREDEDGRRQKHHHSKEEKEKDSSRPRHDAKHYSRSYHNKGQRQSHSSDRQYVTQDRHVSGSDETSPHFRSAAATCPKPEVVAIDCEMVGVNPTSTYRGKLRADGTADSLARVSIVDSDGKCLYDKYVKHSDAEVVDYRTNISGITEEKLNQGEPFVKIQREVREILKGKIVVGHGLQHDLEVLRFGHDKKMRRDSAECRLFRRGSEDTFTPALRTLAKKYLRLDIQKEEHCSVEDARATMRLYVMFKGVWEKEVSGV